MATFAIREACNEIFKAKEVPCSHYQHIYRILERVLQVIVRQNIVGMVVRQMGHDRLGKCLFEAENIINSKYILLIEHWYFEKPLIPDSNK